MEKIYYDSSTYDILMIVPMDYDDTGTYFSSIPNVIGVVNDLVPILDTDGNKTGHYTFPFNDMAKLRTIAKNTIDYMVQKKQDSGYTHTSGVVYSSTERARSMLLGKINEITILGSTSNIIYPDINGNPITHTDVEIKDVGVKMAQYIEGVFGSGLAKKAQIDDVVNTTTLADLEVILSSGV